MMQISVQNILFDIQTSGLVIARKNLYSKVGVYTDEPVVWRSDALDIVDGSDVRLQSDSVKYTLCIQLFN